MNHTIEIGFILKDKGIEWQVMIYLVDPTGGMSLLFDALGTNDSHALARKDALTAIAQWYCVNNINPM